MDDLFRIANLVVLPGWALLLLVPHWRFTQRVCALALPLLLGSLYIGLMSAGLGEGGFDSLENVMKLFRQPRAVLAGWVHYLAFDLFIGAWIVRDAAAAGVPRWIQAPCLVFTFLLGPVGLSGYFLTKGLMKRQWGPQV
ncbi:MAG: ABA4-like family protein [Acidobacteriota bacterium]